MHDINNRRAYLLRYTDIDSSLKCAQIAYNHSEKYPDSKAEALNHISFVLYQQMRFTEAESMLDKIDSITNNQVELLCADVMRMKISQRTGELRTFHNAWHSAQRRLNRIDEEAFMLSPHFQERLYFARSEVHLISSTYYFYSQQDSASLAELRMLDNMMVTPKDTAQWLNYMYMLGASNIIKGDSAHVSINEFDNLMHVLTAANRVDNKYFMANSLQAISLMLDNPKRMEWISKQRGGSIEFLLGQYCKNIQNPIAENSMPLLLIEQSLNIFKNYADLFQTANVLRTRAELFFKHERYPEALQSLEEAVAIIEMQHSIDPKRVSYWEAHIFEKLSLTYSALGEHTMALKYRKRYHDLLNAMRQDLEEDARKAELHNYNKKLYANLSIIAIIVLFLTISLWFLSKKIRKYNKRQDKIAEETLQNVVDNISARKLELSKERVSNIERRAKISLAENVVPYINRLLKTNDSEYIVELSSEIQRINDILTQWIQVRQGKVAMNISTFSLQSILDIIGRNKSIYSNKGLTLIIPDVDYAVKADRALTLFMINTLCDNARKFTADGGTIEIMLTADEEFVEISVKDTGCGLSAENVERINNEKIFRINPIVNDKGLDSENRTGFGFGLMNCKGIIGEMKKLSNRFRVCDFGVESKIGEGSRFWFRLPRVLSLMILLFSMHISANVGSDYNLSLLKYELLQESNASQKFSESIVLGEEALLSAPHDSIHLRMQIENELALAYQSIKDWEAYRYHNLQYLRLYRTITADPSLPVYAKRLHMLKTETSWSFLFTIILLLFSVLMLGLYIRRSSRRRHEHKRQEELLTEQTELLNRLQFELDRLHVQNKILDNSLSTIKHETMYYPARLRQLAIQGNTSQSELSQLITYYHQIYTILLEQAHRQTAFRVAFDDAILDELKCRIKTAISDVPVETSIQDKGKLLEVRIKSLHSEIPDNLFTFEGANLDAFVAREIIRMHDAASGYPGLRLYVENNEIIITLWKNSKLLSSKMFSWN
ncbi:MAG: DUF5112 domain-containing protein [Bacteroidaceae bacterium]|nr:DUF5112 domain-containing protein [Bacteroidaceae bacterium]